MRKFKRKFAQLLAGVGAGVITATTLLPGAAGAADTLFAHVGETLEVETGDSKEYMVGEEKVEFADKSINDEDVYALSFSEKTPVIEEKNISIEDGEVVGNKEDKEMALIDKGDGVLDEEEETTIAAAIKKLEAEGKGVTYEDVQSIVWTVETDTKVYPVETINMEALKKVYASIEDGSVIDSITGLDVEALSAKSDKNDYIVFYYLPQVTSVQETVESVEVETTTPITVDEIDGVEITSPVAAEEVENPIYEGTTTIIGEGEYPAQSFIASGDGIKVTAKADGDTFPAGTTMKIQKVSNETAFEFILDVNKKTSASYTSGIVADISFYDKDGNEIEPLNDNEVEVSIEYEEELPQDYDLFHKKDSGEIEKINVDEVSDNTVEFSLDEFSLVGELVDAGTQRYLTMRGSDYSYMRLELRDWINWGTVEKVYDNAENMGQIHTTDGDTDYYCLNPFNDFYTGDMVAMPITDVFSQNDVNSMGYLMFLLDSLPEYQALSEADKQSIKQGCVWIVAVQGMMPNEVPAGKTFFVEYLNDDGSVNKTMQDVFDIAFNLYHVAYADLDGYRDAKYVSGSPRTGDSVIEYGGKLLKYHGANGVAFKNPDYPYTMDMSHDGTSQLALRLQYDGDVEEKPNDGRLRVKKNSDAQTAVDGGSNGQHYEGYSLEGGVFDVFADEGCTDKKGDLTTDAWGYTGYLTLPVGTYWITERVAPNGHKVAEGKIRVDVTPQSGEYVHDDTSTYNLVEITDNIERVNITLTKKSADTSITNGNDNYSLAGAEFGLYCTEADANAKQNALHVFVTDVSGKATNTYEGAWNGTYYIRELKAPKGYKLDEGVKQFTTHFENEYNYVFNEDVTTTSATVIKKSANPELTNENNNYSLEGATFEAYSDANCTKSIGSFTTKADGTSTPITGLALGQTVYIKETKAPKGFKLDTKVQSVTLKEGTNSVTFTDEPNTTTISLKKVSADPSITNGNDCYSLAGGEFGVYESKADANQDKNRVGTFTTKADGTSNTISNLPMKTYYVKEVKAPKGFKINTEVKTVEAKAGTNTVEFADEPGRDPNYLQVIKKDAGSDTSLDMSGAEFTLYYYPNSKWEGEPTEAVKATTRKGSNGIYMAEFNSIKLPAGSYMVKETKAPAGYKVNPKEFKGQIVVNDDGTVSAESIGVVEQGAGAQVLVNESRDERVIKTTATDKNTGVHSGVTGTTTITDVVSYKNLYEGKTYTMKGTLMDKATGEPLTINGKTFVITKEFTPNKPDGTVALDFNVPTSSLAGKSTVVFEELYAKGSITDNDKPVSEHKDIDDKEQEVKFPSVGTKAIDKNSTIQAGVNGKTTYIDTVSYTNLDVGSKYKVKGILMDKETGKELLINGKTVTGSETFDCKEENGNVKIEFNIDASSLAGKSVVVFEKLFIVKKDGTEVEVAKHENINDGKQEIATPEIITKAEDFQTKNHTAVVGKTILKDTVKYTNLIPNKKYTISGTLMDKETGKPIQVDGKDVKSKPTEFTPTERNGSVVIEFEVDTSTLQGKKTVVFEDLFYEGVKLTSHADINDEEQAINIPKIRTTAIDGQTENHTGVTGITTIVDTVKYENLTIGQEYIMEGIVMDKATGKELKVNGKTVTASQKFTPQKSQNGTVDVTFNIDASELKGKDVVVFETLLQGKLKITEHKSINDKGQTINYAEIKTKAINKDTQNQTNISGKTTIIDTVSYKNLTVDQEYFIEGKLVDKATGEFLKDENGNIITNKIPFTPKESTGTVEVPLDIDTSLLQGKKIVVFEKLYQGEVEVTSHEDLEDIPQNTEVPTLGTTATDIQTGNHTGVSGISTIVDEVKYTGLTIGQKYIVKGVLMDKETGEPVIINGEEVVAEQPFTVGEEIEYTHSSMQKETEDTETDKEKTTDTQDTDKEETDKDTKETVTEVTDEQDEDAEATDEVTEVEAPYEGIEGVTTNGVVKLFYDLDAKELKGHDVVVFETLYQIPNDETEKETPVETELTPEGDSQETTSQPVKVISHEDIEDEGQTVHIPEAITTATDKNTETHTAVVGKTTIVDKVEFTGLTPGESYTFKGVLMDKETGEPIMQDGKEVTAEAVLESAEAASGSQLLEFEVDTELVAGRSVVAFEEVYYKDIMIADHKDIEDEEQTVNVPTIATTATGQNGKTVEYGSSVTIVDTVTYTNLTVGESYTMSGTMVDQNGNAVSNVESVPFVAESADGSVDVTFVIDTTAHAGEKLVAFEELTAENGTKITEHKDLNDEGQTVYVDVPPEVPPTVAPPTGNKSGVVVAAGVAGAAAVAAAGLALSKKRKKED